MGKGGRPAAVTADSGQPPHEIADQSPIALRLAKESINRRMNVEAGLDFERIAGALCSGLTTRPRAHAFREDRDPEFTGRDTLAILRGGPMARRRSLHLSLNVVGPGHAVCPRAYGVDPLPDDRPQSAGNEQHH